MSELGQRLQSVQSLWQQGDEETAKTMFTQLPFADFREESELQTFGLLALQMGFFRAATQIFQRSLEFFPYQVLFWHNLGIAYMELGELSDAQKNFEKSLELNPSYDLAYLNLGTCHERAGKLQSAIDCFNKALTLNSGLYQVHIRLGIVSERLNAKEKMVEHADLAFSLNQDHPDVFYLRCFRFLRSEDWEQALSSIDTAIEKNPQNAVYYFLKVRVLEKLSRFDDAITCLNKANQMAEPGASGKAKAIVDHQDMMSMLKTIPAQTKQKPHNKGFLFVLGCPRSGTTLLAEMLGVHSQIQNFGELNFLEKIYLEALRFLKCSDQMALVMEELWIKDNQGLVSHLRGYYEQLADSLPDRNDDCLWLDKGIMNTFFLPLLAKLLPGAPVIFMQRDGAETAFSIYKQNFSEYYWFKYNYKDAFLHWKQTNEWVPAATEKMGVSSIQLKYEDLIHDAKTQISKVLQSFGLSWEESILDYHQSQSQVDTASYAQVRQSLYSSSLKWCQENYPQIYQEIISS